MKKRLFLIMPFLVLGLGSCSKSNTELPSDTDGKQQGTQEEVKPSLSKALSQMLSGFKASGSLDREIHYLNQFYQSNDQVVTFDASYTFAEDAFESKLLRTSDENSEPTYVTYFKDEDGLLCEEFLKADNTIGLMPLRDTYGAVRTYSNEVINPFLFVQNESLFKKVDDTTFTLEGDSATDFIYYLTDDATVDGIVTFKISTDSVLSSIEIKGASEDSFLISSGTFTPRVITVSGTFTFSTTDLTIENRLEPEETKTSNSSLKEFLDSLDKHNLKLTTYLDEADPQGSATIPYYFKDDMILLPMGGMGISTEPQDMDLLFVENDEGTMDLYIYLSGVWMENDPEMMEWYYTKETFDDLAPLVSGVSADIFTLDSETQSFVANEKATKTLGQYFVPRVTDALSLMAMDDLCYSCTDVTLTLMEGMATVFIDSSYSNGGLSVTGSTGFIIEKDGTFPYEITLPE